MFPCCNSADSDSLLGAARHRVAVGKPRRVRRWPDDQQYLPGKKKKRLVDQESPVLKEESQGSVVYLSCLYLCSVLTKV